MADTKDRVETGLSEVRTTILGGQILLGFQYQALFQPGFFGLSPASQAFELAGFALLLLVVGLLIAPVSHHQISEHGDMTGAQDRYTNLAVAAAMAPFALAIGLDLVIATESQLGLTGAAILGTAATVVALASWYGVEIVMRRPTAPPPAPDMEASLKEKVSRLLSETRIVLPGVQALLGFQLAAYLTQAFATLSEQARAAHLGGLVLLLISMILLMAPATFHRIAERGEDTSRVYQVGGLLILSGLAALGFALIADLYVVVVVVTGSTSAASGAGIAAACVLMGIWFGYPMVRRWAGRHPLASIAANRPGGQSRA